MVVPSLLCTKYKALGCILLLPSLGQYYRHSRSTSFKNSGPVVGLAPVVPHLRARGETLL